MHGSSHTAILFFSRTPGSEAREKHAAGRSYYSNKSLQKILWKHSLSQLRASGMPVVVFDESKQRGEDFAERFINAITDFFSIGYKNVIAVGNDCPELSNISWSALEERLRNNETVLGPTNRQGAYLLAFNKNSFDAKTFRALPWRNDGLFDSLVSYFEQRSASVHVLRSKTDINDPGDIEAFLNSSFTGSLKAVRNLLIQLFAAMPKPVTADEKYLFTPIFRHSSRAPPFSASLF